MPLHPSRATVTLTMPDGTTRTVTFTDATAALQWDITEGDPRDGWATFTAGPGGSITIHGRMALGETG